MLSVVDIKEWAQSLYFFRGNNVKQASDGIEEYRTVEHRWPNLEDGQGRLARPWRIRNGYEVAKVSVIPE